MGYALFVSFDRSIPGVEGWNLCGKTLARSLETLDDVARQLHLLPLSDLISISEDELAELLDEAIEGVGEEQWFSPATGLATVNALLTVVQQNPAQFEQPSDLLDDLTQLKHDLECAEQHQALFHLTPDF